AAAIRPGDLLLVLDNFEHIVAAAPFVADVLAVCPQLTVLVTSRAALRVGGEREFPGTPLAWPAPALGRAVDRTTNSPAVRLFVGRARSVDPKFALTDENAPAIAAICARLDGLPLAIELAAARVRLFPPAALLTRLGRRLPLLTDGRRDRPERHQTMRDAIAWSCDLLADEAARIFRGLSVFVGGFTLGDAEATVGAAESASFALHVEALIDGSLLRRIDDGGDAGPRLAMLETVREFGREQLAARGEADAALDAHAAHFLALAETFARELAGPDQRWWLARLDAERPNLRAAYIRFRDRGRAEEALRLVAALGGLRLRRGQMPEGWPERDAALAMPADPGLTAMRARALVVGSLAAEQLTERAAAHALGEQALAAYRMLDDAAGVASARRALGGITINRGDFDDAERLLDAARAALEAAGAAAGVGQALDDRGGAACARGGCAGAGALFEAGLACQREAGDAHVIGVSLDKAACLALIRGEHIRAATDAEALALHLELGSGWDLGWVLAGFAGLAAAAGETERAARLFGAAAERFAAERVPLRPSLAAVFDRLLEPAWFAMGSARFAAAQEAGRALSLEDALADVEIVRRRMAEIPRRASRAASRYGLTPRETDVLRLLAVGKTNREIAKALFITHRTAEAHVAHLLTKLGAANRTEAAAIAGREGLA
ncbi:MAG: hypothetical protein IT337_18635, partial [Thermomicrobiales bacterium]|nr:hypothetical protein [Thermomicrobiales bacterium]